MRNIVLILKIWRKTPSIKELLFSILTLAQLLRAGTKIEWGGEKLAQIKVHFSKKGKRDNAHRHINHIRSFTSQPKAYDRFHCHYKRRKWRLKIGMMAEHSAVANEIFTLVSETNKLRCNKLPSYSIYLLLTCINKDEAAYKVVEQHHLRCKALARWLSDMRSHVDLDARIINFFVMKHEEVCEKLIEDLCSLERKVPTYL